MSNFTDGFGILPWNYEPGFFKRLFGHIPFTVSSECITYRNKSGIQACIGYDTLESIEQKGNKLIIVSEGQTHTLKYDNAAALCELIKKIVAEDKEYCEFIKLTSIIPEVGIAYFDKAFRYRGDPYVCAADYILYTSIRNGFTDLHFEPQQDFVKISYRCNGKLKAWNKIDTDNYKHFLARIKFMFGCNSQITNEAQEGSYSCIRHDVRLSTFPTDNGERVSFRFISTIKFPTINSLGWSAEASERWLKLVTGEPGLYLITGSVGSGKTTAMYATISELLAAANDCIRAVTIEDPVEANIEGICQSSLDTKTEKSLASAFKHLLRQDPDIIAIGEIRDAECITEALQAGLSGHMILATFHAGSPEDAIDRIKMMAAGNELILSGLKGILHLKLTYNGETACPFPIIKELSK